MALEADKGKYSSSMGPRCGQARPGKFSGGRTPLDPGVNGVSRLSAKTKEIKL